MSKRKRPQSVGDKTAGARRRDVPDVWPVLAAVSDVHLDTSTPSSRGEKDWFEVQAQCLKSLGESVASLEVPLVYVGDLFHRYNPPPELINFAIKHLPRGYAVPGNHDLPNHDYGQVNRSAYHTLREAGVLEDLPPGVPIKATECLFLWGFTCGRPVVKTDVMNVNCVNVAVVHDYCWKEGAAFPGVLVEKHVSRWADLLDECGYDAGVFGDNHQPFLADHREKPCIANCGCFNPRRSDEAGIRPSVCVLMSDGTWKREALLSVEQTWVGPSEWEGLRQFGVDPEQVLEAVHRLHSHVFNFRAEVIHHMQEKNTPKRVQDMVLAYLEKVATK